MPKKESDKIRETQYKLNKVDIDLKHLIETIELDKDYLNDDFDFNKKRKPETRGRKKGQRSGKSQKTIQRYNWIRDMLEIVKKKRLGHTNNEFAGLILSEMKENTPRFFENHIYKKSTILKVLKNKSWGDD
jgi:hypothetical protein